jgi:hypothetical protein
MGRLRTTMRQIPVETRLHLRAHSLSGRMENTLLLAALYGAFAVIGAIIFGTLAVRLF